jgi:flagellar hook protein FlgE
VKADATSIALSGIAAGQKRLQGSSHNIANLLTEDFHPVRTEQSEVAEGGVQATQEHSAEPEEVSIAKEFAEQALASLQVKASARALNAAIDTLGSLLDIRR